MRILNLHIIFSSFFLAFCSNMNKITHINSLINKEKTKENSNKLEIQKLSNDLTEKFKIPLCINGYIKQQEKELNIFVPIEIIKIILKFSSIDYEVYNFISKSNISKLDNSNKQLFITCIYYFLLQSKLTIKNIYLKRYDHSPKPILQSNNYVSKIVLKIKNLSDSEFGLQIVIPKMKYCLYETISYESLFKVELIFDNCFY